jgi:hypothetical protein
MEPERKIEKWLKSYAKKRRGQAVGFKLDPATRQRLQNEVSRNAPSEKDDDETMSLWQLIRQQWAFLIGFAVCIFLAAMVFFWSGSKKQPMQLSKAPTMDQLKTVNAPAPAAAPAEPAAQTATAPAPQDEATPVMTPPPASARELYEREGPSSQQAGQTFASAIQPAPASQNAFMNAAVLKSASSPVLENFHVVQNGNAIRVVDQDGSVYIGILQTAPPMVASNLGADQHASVGQAGSVLADTVTQSVEGIEANRPAPAAPFGSTSDGMSASTLGGTSGGTLQSAQNNSSPSPPTYTFRVTGFNQTLKQNVQFIATVQGDIAAAQSTQMPMGQTANAAFGARPSQSTMQYQPGPLPWSNLTITGTATINRTNQIQVNATPVPPTQ